MSPVRILYSSLNDLQKISKWSYIDIKREASMIVLPVVVIHAVGYWARLFTIAPSMGEFVWHFSIGAAYLTAHLSRFGPNLYDNFALRKCSVSLEYCSKPALRFSFKTFAVAEMLVLVDDLFAFSSHVPSIFRAAVWTVHLVYLTQLFLLPKDDPMKGKLQKRHEATKERKVDKKKAPKQTRPENRSEGGLRESSDPLPHAKTPLSEREMQLFADLDGEQVLWLDLAQRQYIGEIVAVAAENQNSQIALYCPFQ